MSDFRSPPNGCRRVVSAQLTGRQRSTTPGYVLMGDRQPRRSTEAGEMQRPMRADELQFQSNYTIGDLADEGTTPSNQSQQRGQPSHTLGRGCSDALFAGLVLGVACCRCELLSTTCRQVGRLLHRAMAWLFLPWPPTTAGSGGSVLGSGNQFRSSSDQGTRWPISPSSWAQRC